MTALRISQVTGTRGDLLPVPRWHQLVFTTFSMRKDSSPLAFLRASFPAFLYITTKLRAVPVLHQHHHARLQEEARSDCEAGGQLVTGSLGNRLLLSENADPGRRDRQIRDDVKPGEGRPISPNLTHYDLPLGPKPHLPKVSVNYGETRFQTGHCRHLRRVFHHTATMGRKPAARCFNVGATLRGRLPF